jgi:hypothetical protein
MQHEYCPEADPTSCTQASRHDLKLTLANINLSASYFFNDWLGIAINQPIRIVVSEAGFLDSNNEVIEGFASAHHRDEVLAGPSDLNLSLALRTSQRIEQNLSWFVAGNIGLTIPTGNVVDSPEVVGMWKDDHQHMFFGRGMPAPSFSASGSLRMSWGFLESNLSLTLPIFKTASKDYTPPQGRQVPQMGDWDYYDSGQYLAPIEVSGSIGVGSGFGSDTWTLTAIAQSLYESQSKWQGIVTANSGRTEIILGVRTSLMLGNGMMAELSVKIPVYLHMPTEGSQLDMPFLFGFGFYFVGDA